MIDAGAAQSFFDQRLIRVDIAEQNRDVIERRALLRERADAAGDLDALEAFARRREQQRCIGRRRWRLSGREEPGADAIESRGGRCGVDILRRRAKNALD